jgi:hypothetical protein
LQSNVTGTKKSYASFPGGFISLKMRSAVGSLASCTTARGRDLLDECGLNTAIRSYVRGINQRNGLHVEVEIPQDLRRLSEET